MLVRSLTGTIYFNSNHPKMSSQETETFEDLDVSEDDNHYKIDDDCDGLLLHNGSVDDFEELLFQDHSDDDFNY